MGQSYSTSMGYGLLVLDGEEPEDEDGYPEYDPPLGVEAEPVGDGVLGEDCGLFYMVTNVKVDLDSEVPYSQKDYISEYVTEYAEYTLGDILPEIEAWFNKVQEETDGVCKLGVFRVSNYG